MSRSDAIRRQLREGNRLVREAAACRDYTISRATGPSSYAEQMRLIRGINRDHAPLLEALADE